MASNFRASLAETLKWEGGFANHPSDPGGATMKGITLNTYRRWKPHATVDELKKIPQSIVEKIYRADYWDKAGCDRLHTGVDLATFDYAVNSGPSAATKSLRAVLGGKDWETVQRLCRRRISIYRTFKHWATFSRGWSRRVHTIEAKGILWAADGGKAILAREADRAAKFYKVQSAGAGGSVGGGILAKGEAPPEFLMIIGVVVVAFAGFMILKAKRNKDRTEVFREELETPTPPRRKVRIVK